MIEFVTLLLGIVTGPHLVEVVVQPRVEAVEFRLEQRVVGRLEAPPWKLEIDFGSEIVPGELEAIALDGNGTEIGRAAQPINRPRKAAEARLILERDEGRVTSARVTWQSTVSPAVRESFASFDGEPLEIRDGGRIDLPSHDSEAFHLLQAELVFVDGTRAEAQLGFGGGQMDEVRTDLTAVPVSVRGKARRREGPDLEGLLSQDGEPLKVVAVERGQAKIVVVRAEGIVEKLREMGAKAMSSIGGTAFSNGGVVPGAGATAAERLQQTLRLPDDEDLGLMIPLARHVQHPHLQMELFARSPWITQQDGGLYWALTQRILLPGGAREQRLADAVAVAALEAAAGNRRRAVVLVVSPDSEDRSRYSMPVVERFLAALDVPLYVWSVTTNDAESNHQEAKSGEREVGSFRALTTVVRELEKDLDAQRIFWISGEHPVGSVVLSPRAESLGIRRLSPLGQTGEDRS